MVAFVSVGEGDVQDAPIFDVVGAGLDITALVFSQSCGKVADIASYIGDGNCLAACCSLDLLQDKGRPRADDSPGG